MVFSIGSEVLASNDLAKFPFVHFDAINLNYESGSHLIANKCEMFVSHLKKLQQVGNANSICVSANISQKQAQRHKRHGDFRNHKQLLKHLRNELLPICGYCRQFEFRIGLVYDNYAVTNVITSILQMQQVNECSNVYISLVIPNQYEELPVGVGAGEQLPVEAISKWLHRSQNTNGGNEFVNQSQHERVFEIDVGKVSNVMEMCSHLKKVILGFLRCSKAKNFVGTCAYNSSLVTCITSTSHKYKLQVQVKIHTISVSSDYLTFL